MKVFKSTETQNDYTITLYTPLDSPGTILRFSHYPALGEEPEFVVIEHNILGEAVVPVKLQKAKKVKQTKDIEYFDIEVPQKVYQPVFLRVNKPEEVQHLLSILEVSCV
jgi:hypothetical protein